MIEVTSHAEGAVLPVRAKAAAKTNALVDERDGTLIVSVTAPPEHGKANAALVETLAECLNLRRTQIELISGATAKIKRFLVRGISPEDLVARIDAVLTPTVYEPPDPDV
jgi:uncharacterized protein YggU (UPF0235/DUF167 family)